MPKKRALRTFEVTIKRRCTVDYDTVIEVEAENEHEAKQLGADSVKEDPAGIQWTELECIVEAEKVTAKKV